jgi:hypothetical protein
MAGPGFNTIIGYVVAMIYVALGLAVFLQSGKLIQVPAGYSTPLGLVLIFYGIFRGYRSYQKNTF